MQKFVEELFTLVIYTAGVLFFCLAVGTLATGNYVVMVVAAFWSAYCNHFVARRQSTVRVYAGWVLNQEEVAYEINDSRCRDLLDDSRVG